MKVDFCLTQNYVFMFAQSTVYGRLILQNLLKVPVGRYFVDITLINLETPMV